MENEDFVTYEQALALKKLGFKERCYQYYDASGIKQDNDVISNEVFQFIISSQLCRSHNSGVPKETCDAPTLAQAQKWLRKEKQIDIEINVYLLGHHEYRPVIFNCNDNAILLRPYSSYEEALSVGITKCIKFLENGTNRRTETDN